MSLKANIIGAGNLGKTLAHLLVKNELICLGAICNRSEESAKRAIEFIGKGSFCSSPSALPYADLTLISTPDDHIAETCLALSKNGQLKPGNLVLHFSGSLTSEALNPVKELGCYVASLHPMRSFANPEISVHQYSGTYCAVEGDAEAVRQIRALFDAIGSISYEITKEKKSIYHAAGVFASNYLVTLSQQALACLLEVGLDQDMAMGVITSLMQGTLLNLKTTSSPTLSLTGPIKRGDALTIQNHMRVLNDDRQTLYSTLGQATIPLANLDEDKVAQVIKALSNLALMP
jgi:predicted short-subunit dehydrogenase-like oxidoreductase (DUF2520 family)